MNALKILGKYLDQPIITAKFSQAVPKLMLATGLGITANAAYKEDTYKKAKKSAINTSCTLVGTIASALIATRGLKINAKVIVNGLSEIITPKEVLKENKQIIRNLKKTLDSGSLDGTTRELFNNPIVKKIIEKIAQNTLSLGAIKILHKELGNNPTGKKFLEEIHPTSKAVKAQDIWKELGRLSLLGAIPVMGGIAGGITGDKLTSKHWKQRVPDKIKEGAYQYLANIVLCNIGAGIALATLDMLQKGNVIKSLSPTTRTLSMLTGIILTGIIGGSATANYIGGKLIDPVLDINHPHQKGLYSERHPEALDIGLHVDDMATIGVMSGFKWIEPALPIFYSISGYRAGIGYRNGAKHDKPEKHPHFKSNY